MPRKSSPAVQFVVESLAVPIPIAAQMLGGTVRSVRGLLWAKKLPYVKLGKKFVIPVDALREFVRSWRAAQSPWSDGDAVREPSARTYSVLLHEIAHAFKKAEELGCTVAHLWRYYLEAAGGAA